MTKNLIVSAGINAYQTVKEKGLKQEMIKIISGAAGGPKWLVLNRFDRMLFSSLLKNRSVPLHLIGSSIGAWRFAAMSQSDPIKAQAKLEESYINQRYDSKPTPAEITAESNKIMESFLDESGIEYILNHPWIKLSFMSVRSRGFISSESKIILGSGLLGSFLLNMINRKLLNLLFERTVFTQSHNSVPFSISNGFPAKRIQLTPQNFRKALLSSGSIPLVMEGIKGIPGTTGGVYRDGGVMDYHLDLPFAVEEDEIVLFPHFTGRIIPGWLDKSLKWRKPDPRHMKNILMVAPSEDYISNLPNRKIPDRNDFWLYKGRDDDRFRDWKIVVEKGQVLADEFYELIQSGRIRDVVTPL